MEITIANGPLGFIYKAFQYLPTPVFIMDSVTYKFIEVNEGACQHTGYTRKELLSKGPQDLNPAFNLDSLKYFLSTKFNGESIQIETLHKAKNGDLMDVELSLTPFEEHGHKYVLAQVITVRKDSFASTNEDKLSFYNRYKFLVENAQVGIWQVDEHFNIVFVNDYFANILEFTKVEMVGKNALEFVPAQETDATRLRIIERTKGIANQYERLFISKTGKKLCFLVQPSPIMKDGIYKGSIATLLNITDTKEKEEKARIKDRWFKAVVENSTDAICLLSAEGKTLYVSPTIEKMGGYTEVDFLGNNINWDDFYPGDAEIFKHSFEEVTKTPKHTVTVTYRHKIKNGNYVWIEAKLTNLLQESGINGIVLNFRDITERKEAEVKLKESEIRNKKAQAQGKLGNFEMNLSNKIIIWSDEVFRIFGLNNQDKAPAVEEFLSYVHEDDRKFVKDETEEAIKNLKGFDLTHRIVLKDGSIKYIHAIGDITYDNILRDYKMIGMLQDITKQVSVELKLKESQERYIKAEKLAKIGHWERDLETNILLWSDNLYKLFEMERGETVNLELFILMIHPEDRQFVNDAIAEMALGKALDIQYRIISNNGDIRFIHEVGQVVYSTATHPLKVSGFSQDVTDEVMIKEELLKVQERYKIAEKQGNLGHWQWDVVTNEIIWSDHLYTIFDINPQEKIDYERFISIIHPDDQEAVNATIRQSVKEGNDYSITHRVIYKSGAIRFIKEEAQIIKNTQGQVLKVTGIAQDVTNRIIAAKKLQRSNEKYRFLFNKSPIPMFMVDHETLQFIQVNEAAIKQYGFSEKEFLESNLWTLRVDPGDYQMNDHPTEKAINDPIVSVVRHRNKDGRILHIRRSVIKTKFNNRSVWLMSCIDVSFEIVYEQQLKKSQEQLSLIFNTTLFPMWLLNVEGGNMFRYVEVNNAYSFHTGYEKTSIAGKLTDDADFFNTYPRFKNRYLQVMEEGHTLHFTVELKLMSGIKIADVTISPIKNDTGQIMQLLCSAIDVTDKKIYEDELIAKNQQLRELTAYQHKVREEERTYISREIHDELGQLLTAIKLDIAWVKKHYPEKEGLVRLHETLQLVDETISSMRKISSALRPSILDDLGLSEALASHGNDFAQRTGIDFYLKDEMEKKNLSKDIATTLYRVFQEGLTNIMRHANASTVICHLYEKDEFIFLKIKDNGVGIVADVNDKKNKTFGLLGMKERIDMLNGELTVYSIPEAGTELNIKLPLTLNES